MMASTSFTFPQASHSQVGDKKSKAVNVLPKIPSNESLSNSPGPASPGISREDKNETSTSDRNNLSAMKLTRKESYKAQRKNYRREKKRVANELLSSFKDPAVIVLADWLKVRGTLKSWTKLWCVLKPGLLLLYKSPKTKSNHWVGTVLLNTCQVIERPSKKNGFCFKLFHPLEQSIWAPRGPQKETIGAVVQPLPTAYLIFRAPSQAAGKCWLDALELSLRCSSLLVRSMSSRSSGGGVVAASASINHETQWSEADYEKHFKDHDLDDLSQPENNAHLSGIDADLTDSESELSAKEEEELGTVEETIEPLETPYVLCDQEELGCAGEQVEELAEEHKSLIWFLVKQVRPGMDLSKVVLPTFILEPRSFLDKLSDSYYHVDILSRAVLEDDAFTRMKSVVQWYLSGLYKKPRGLKKPYNPVLGETFRCCWRHPNGSRTFYLAEQVSHHPPVSAFYVTNRQDGFCISASILAKSKFYGNSTSAILDGVAVLTLLPRGEDYCLTVPYAHCKGILMGTLTMELGGKVAIHCEKTGYCTEIDFKLKPFLGGTEHINCISGRLKLGKETLATIDGYWDGVIKIKDRRTGEQHILWNPTPSIRSSRLKRYVVPVDHQNEFESERLWQHVSSAIARDDQLAATEEKTVLEEAQRATVKERKAKCEEWLPRYFEQDLKTGQWVYRHADLRPWDPRNDVYQFEYGYVIQTKTRHITSKIRTNSLVSVDPQTLPLLQTESLSSLSVLKSSKRKLAVKQISSDVDVNESGTTSEEFHSDSTQSAEKIVHLGGASVGTTAGVLNAVRSLETILAEHGEKLNNLQYNVDNILKKEKTYPDYSRTYIDAVMIVILIVLVQMFWMYLGS